MTVTDEYGMHLIGYFSKEKSSAEDYNVACILTLPQYQRKGYGKLQIAFSYELTKHEKKLGSPEKPLSDLGLLSYRSFWAEHIIELLLKKNDISLVEIGEITAFTMDDIMQTLQAMEILKYVKGHFILHLADDIIEKHETRRTKNAGKLLIDPTSLDWVPPKFQASQLRFI